MADENVIRVEFGAQRNETELRKAILDSFLEVGALLGDEDRELMKLKADRAFLLLQEMLAPFRIELDDDPKKLSLDQLIDAAVQKTRERCVNAVVNALTELCTSALRR